MEMRLRFGLLTLLVIVALTATLSWWSWRTRAGHGELGPVPAKMAEQFGVPVLPGKPVWVSSVFYGVPFESHERLVFSGANGVTSVQNVNGWGAAANVLVSLVLSCVAVFGLRAISDWWHTYRTPRHFSRSG